MQILTSPDEIRKVITSLINRYQYFDWLCAWASVDFIAYNQLEKNQSRCRRVIIGTHFFQTHPLFIESLNNNIGVKFIKQTNELFHPKSYLFFNSTDDWQLLIGSANFTKAAFSRNVETMLWINSKEAAGSNVLKDFLTLVDHCWLNAEKFSDKEIVDYRNAWQNTKSKRDSLSRTYGSIPEKNPLKNDVRIMTWKEYILKLNNEPSDIEIRIKLLNHIREQFDFYKSFKRIPMEVRKFIAGVENRHHSGIESDYKVWMAFGNMSGSGFFANRVISNDTHLGQAIDTIPLNGQVTRDDYTAFVQKFIKTFSANSIATATRLLAMKRPDLFYCLTSANKRMFCKEFSLTYSKVNLNTYWDMVIEPIQDCEWWLNSRASNNLEEGIKAGRAAFLDSLYYDELQR